MEKILKNFLDFMYNLCKIILYTMWVIAGIIYLYLMFTSITTFNLSLFISLNIMLFVFVCIWFVSYCDNRKNLNPSINTIYQKTKTMLYIIGGIGYFLILLLLIGILKEGVFKATEAIGIIETSFVIVFPLVGLIIIRAFFNRKIRYAFYVYAIIIITFVFLHNFYIIGSVFSIGSKDSETIKIDYSKIATLDHKANLHISNNIPHLGGAYFLQSLYSSFANAVYPKKEYDNIKNYDYSDSYDYYDNYYNEYTVDIPNYMREKNIDLNFAGLESNPISKTMNYLNERYNYVPIGKDAIVFFTSKQNKVNNLSTSQIKNIYSGLSTNWKDLGGKKQKIILCHGTGLSDSYAFFMKDYFDAPFESHYYENYPNALGFGFLHDKEFILKNKNIKLLSINGVNPTKNNISNGKYPFNIEIVAVAKENNTNKNTQKLLDWILSSEGQELIDKSGYVKVK